MKKTLGLIPAALLTGLLFLAWFFLTGKSSMGFLSLFFFTVSCAFLIRSYMHKIDPESSLYIRSKIEDIRGEGKAAFLCGDPKVANPYTGADGELWDEGYDLASKQNAQENKL
ncbi:hypothetical protein THF5H11_10502 [Vibrio jasicida]|uniref:hypothetical protein n=1 Tax=Vibrio jasicida TaxID=766224 RepID=UPI00289598F5|nr:hypothetical protein THF5H11_10502 [Vibrio jasicida]